MQRVSSLLPAIAWRFVVFLASTGLTVTAVPAAQPAPLGSCAVEITAPEAVTEALDRLLTSLVDPANPRAAYNGYAPGAVLWVEAPDWQYARSAGHVAAGSDIAMDCSLPYEAGSSTKMLTGAVLLQLQEEGLLSIDERLAKYLPEAAAAIPNGEIITLRQLANHTAGVFSYTDDATDGTPGLMAHGVTDSVALSRGYKPQELVDFAVQHGQPDFAPGAENAWSYSNTGYVLLGQIIEQITGKPLKQVFKEHIFMPLGMADSFLWNDVPEPDFGLPKAYFAPPFEFETTSWNLSQGWAAGAVITTAADMTRFIRGLLKGRLFANSATLGLMEETVPTNNPTIPYYGIGLIEKQPGLWGHGGQTLGFLSDVAYFSDDDISVVVWTTSAKNSAVLGAQYVSIALQTAGALKEDLTKE